MKNLYFFTQILILLVSFLFLTACEPAAHQTDIQQTVSIDKSFQTRVTPAPTIPTYICGAWSSVNNPGMYSSIFIYAKLTHNVMGVSGAPASATVHFKYADTTLDQHPVSDAGGYVSFLLPLNGRQPRMNAATVDVTFMTNNTKVRCSQAFFTPQ